MIIRAKSYPRAGLIGNPSDGYFGKTISFSFSNFCAEVVLYESPELEILPCQKDQSCFTSVQALVKDVELHGYYGGIRLLKATIKRFFDYCRDNQIELNTRNFTIRYDSNIPHGVGLAGSSAIITACLRALTTFYGVTIPKPAQASLILSAEVDELHIAAGLQDRVIQVYQGLVYMDFDRALMEKQGHGQYEPVDHTLLPPLYVAYQEDLSEVSSKFHNNIRERFELGDKKIIAAMKYWAQLAAKTRKCLLNGKTDQIGALLNVNFDKRASIYRISPDNIQMVETARALGASAKFTGSGGAIVGTYTNQKMFNALKKELGKLGIKVIKPKLIGPSPSACSEYKGPMITHNTVRKAVIPAAGFGTRFLPATKSQPKEMLPIVDTPVIQYVVEEAVASGITDILMVIGKGKRAIEEHFDRSFQLEDQLERQGKIRELEIIRRVSDIATIHFVWQKEMLGLGHAVLCARHHVGREPFAVLLGDTVIGSDIPATQQLIDVYKHYRSSAVILEEIEREKVTRYGVLKGNEIDTGLYQVEDFVEKPSIEEAPSNLAFAGRYVFTPEIFQFLENTPPGKGGEIQLTDAMRTMVKHQAMYGKTLAGKRHDIGNKEGFIRTNLEFGLKDPEISEQLKVYIKQLAKELS